MDNIAQLVQTKLAADLPKILRPYIEEYKTIAALVAQPAQSGGTGATPAPQQQPQGAGTPPSQLLKQGLREAIAGWLSSRIASAAARGLAQIKGKYKVGAEGVVYLVDNNSINSVVSGILNSVVNAIREVRQGEVGLTPEEQRALRDITRASPASRAIAAFVQGGIAERRATALENYKKALKGKIYGVIKEMGGIPLPLVQGSDGSVTQSDNPTYTDFISKVAEAAEETLREQVTKQPTVEDVKLKETTTQEVWDKVVEPLLFTPASVRVFEANLYVAFNRVWRGHPSVQVWASRAANWIAYQRNNIKSSFLQRKIEDVNTLKKLANVLVELSMPHVEKQFPNMSTDTRRAVTDCLREAFENTLRAGYGRGNIPPLTKRKLRGDFPDPWKPRKGRKPPAWEWKVDLPKPLQVIYQWWNRLTPLEQQKLSVRIYAYLLTYDPEEKKEALKEVIKTAQEMGIPVKGG